MNAKKLISLFASAAMALSAFATVVSAAESKGNVEVNVTKISAATAAGDYAVPTYDETKYAAYEVEITVKDLGAFEATKKKVGKKWEYGGDFIAGVQLTFVPDQKIEDYGSATDEEDTTHIAADGGAAGENLQYNFGPAANAGAAFPKDNVTSDNYSFSFIRVWLAPLGTNVTLSPIAKFNSVTINGINYPIINNETFSVTLGEKQDDKKELGLTIDKTTEAKKENGYIWKLNLTQKNGAQANSFVADFTDSKGDTNQKKAKNNVADFFGGEGSVEFYVGLKTARTITEFKATVADSTAEGVTASDTWTAAE